MGVRKRTGAADVRPQLDSNWLCNYIMCTSSSRQENRRKGQNSCLLKRVDGDMYSNCVVHCIFWTVLCVARTLRECIRLDVAKVVSASTRPCPSSQARCETGSNHENDFSNRLLDTLSRRSTPGRRVTPVRYERALLPVCDQWVR